jgi:hypothetical protein
LGTDPHLAIQAKDVQNNKKKMTHRLMVGIKMRRLHLKYEAIDNYLLLISFHHIKQSRH